MEPLIHLDYPLDKKQLLIEAAEAKKNAKAYGDDPRYPGQNLDWWLISKHSSAYITKIINDFRVNGNPRFYWLEPNAYLPPHIDNRTTCSINFILSDDVAPITFGDKEYLYSQVLLNTTLAHSVKNGSSERIILKISIFDESFEDLAKKIPYKK